MTQENIRNFCIIAHIDHGKFELKCSLDYDTLGKNPEGRKVKGVIHWLSAEHVLDYKKQRVFLLVKEV